MRLGELTYRVTHFYLGIVEASGQLHAPADLSPSEEPLVPTEREAGWEMNTSWTPQQDVHSSRANTVLFFFVFFQFSSHVPSPVPDARTSSTPSMARVNISELNVTKHKILTHIYPEGCTLFPRWSEGNANTQKGTCRPPPLTQPEVLVIIIQPFNTRRAPWKLTFQQHRKPQHVTNDAHFLLLTSVRMHHSILYNW